MAFDNGQFNLATPINPYLLFRSWPVGGNRSLRPNQDPDPPFSHNILISYVSRDPHSVFPNNRRHTRGKGPDRFRSTEARKDKK